MHVTQQHPYCLAFKLNLEYLRRSSSNLDRAARQTVLVETINSLQLPFLKSAAIQVNEFQYPMPDFRPFLIAHPSLQDVDVTLEGELPSEALPHLRSFSGIPIDCVALCDGRRPIETIRLALQGPEYDLSIPGADTRSPPDYKTVPERLAATTTLRKLYLTTDNQRRWEGRYHESEYIPTIAKACPHLTHLEMDTPYRLVSSVHSQSSAIISSNLCVSVRERPRNCRGLSKSSMVEAAFVAGCQ